MIMAAAALPTVDDEHYASITTLDIAYLLTFLSIFLYCYYYTVLSPKTGKPDGFGESTFISNLHSVPLCILALLSLKHVIPESIPLCWSISFFIVDLLDAVVRGEIMWIVHAIISLALNVLTGRNAKHRVLRSVSKGFFAEASTPFLNHWKKSKSYLSFIMFFIAFTLCRVVWVPYFVYTTYALYLHGEIDYLIWPSILFYILQLAWYAKMCTMIVNYKQQLPKELKERLKEQ
ncbi:hypothetical protein ACHAXH_003088 [Discostella pseudostelligera]